MAKAAELNGYPGPKHVLQLAGQLGRTDTQRRDVQAIFDRMSAAAKSLGGELIAQEQTLDQLFVKGVITPDRLAAATAAIAELQGRLRAVHLSPRLETRALLNADQIARYEQLRGYGRSSGTYTTSPSRIGLRHGRGHRHFTRQRAMAAPRTPPSSLRRLPSSGSGSRARSASSPAFSPDRLHSSPFSNARITLTNQKVSMGLSPTTPTIIH